MPKNDKFYAMLEDQRVAYSNGNYQPTIGRFKRWNDLLRENNKSIQRRSSGRRSLRRRSRDISRDIWKNLGLEVLLLCTLAASMDKLATLEIKSLVPDLKRWWKAATHPPSLAEAARNLSKEYSLSEFYTEERNGSEDLQSAAGVASFYEAKDEVVAGSEDSNPIVATEHVVTTFGMLFSLCPFITNISQRMLYILRHSTYPFKSESVGSTHAANHYNHFIGSQISHRLEDAFYPLGRS
jgi:hypothetical protein